MPDCPVTAQWTHSRENDLYSSWICNSERMVSIIWSSTVQTASLNRWSHAKDSLIQWCHRSHWPFIARHTWDCATNHIIYSNGILQWASPGNADLHYGFSWCTWYIKAEKGSLISWKMFFGRFLEIHHNSRQAGRCAVRLQTAFFGLKPCNGPASEIQSLCLLLPLKKWLC